MVLTSLTSRDLEEQAFDGIVIRLCVKTNLYVVVEIVIDLDVVVEIVSC